MSGEPLQWVFAYGSLMWNPGFVHEHAEAAVLHGFHRQLCVRSHIYRGTEEKPGLVFGLSRGGSCQGMAYGVAPARWDNTLAYLRARELVTDVYLETAVQVRLRDTGRQVQAVTYVVDANHPQSLLKLPLAEIVALVRQGQGIAGSNLDYVRNTWQQLKDLGLSDRGLDVLVRHLT